jgi:polyisoprenoid-binding protein YceI
MKRSNNSSAWLAAAWIVLAAAGCENPADNVAPAKVSAPSFPTNPPSASSNTETTLASPAPIEIPEGAEALAFGPPTSTIEFIGSKVTGSHSGGFKSFQGTFALLPDRLESSRIAAEIDMDSTWSDDDRLTGHLKSPDFFDVAKYPTASFRSTAITAGNSDAKAPEATHTITGDLTLHGVTRSIQFPATLAVTQDAASLRSEFSINRQDFGINYPGRANDLIRDEVVIKLAIQAPRNTAG